MSAVGDGCIGFMSSVWGARRVNRRHHTRTEVGYRVGFRAFFGDINKVVEIAEVGVPVAVGQRGNLEAANGVRQS